MDLRTGETYETKDAALAAGVPESDIAEIVRGNSSVPEVRFASGPFKGRTYKRMPNGQLVRIDRPAPKRGMVMKSDDKGDLVWVRG